MTLTIDVKELRVAARSLAEGMHISLANGEILLLRGPNGCGKSALLDEICGLTSFSKIRVQIDNSTLAPGRPLLAWQKGIRRIFQYPSIPSTLTVEDLSDQLNKKEQSRESIESYQNTLTATGIRLRDPIHSHSFGQQRLIEIGYTLMSGKYFLLDEPFSGIDQFHSKHVLDWIKRSVSQSAAVLIVDHDHTATNVTSWNECAFPIEERSTPSALHSHNILDEVQSWSSALERRSFSWELSSFCVGQSQIASPMHISLHPGTALLLFGPNGAGKSSLLRAIGAWPQPSPDILVSFEKRPRSEGILMSPQPPKLVPTLTVHKNLLIMLGDDAEANALAHRMLGWFGFHGRILQSRAEVLSGGESSTIALIGAIASRATLLILDEPFASMSTQTASRAHHLIAAALNGGRSAIISSHRANTECQNADSTLILPEDAQRTASPAWIGSRLKTRNEV
jgi:ABC-type multidrug transport system ATPase subunit